MHSSLVPDKNAHTGSAQASVRGRRRLRGARQARDRPERGLRGVEPETEIGIAVGRVDVRRLINAREIAEPLSGLQVHWTDGAPEFSGSVRIESSDDLGQWRPVKSGAAVIHLLTGRSELVQSQRFRRLALGSGG